MYAALLILTAGFTIGAVTEAREPAAESPTIQWQTDEDKALASALRQDRQVLLYIASPECGFCRKMERDTWSNADVIKTVNNRFIPLKLNGEKSSALLDRLAIRGFPTVVLLNKSGKATAKIEGYNDPENFQGRLKQVK